MKVYISSHSAESAEELAAVLERHGHEVASSWHRTGGPRPATGDTAAWHQKAWNQNFHEIDHADALVVIASPEHLSREKCVPGGKFVEAGFALGTGVGVYTVGGVENGVLAAADRHFADAAELVAFLAAD